MPGIVVRERRVGYKLRLIVQLELSREHHKVHVFQSITNPTALEDYKRKLATMEVGGEVVQHLCPESDGVVV